MALPPGRQTPHDYVTNIQKRLGNRLWEGDGQCRCCGSFLASQRENAETCSTPEATWEHCACVHAVVWGMKLADPGITTEPRGLTVSQSRLADIFTTAAVPGRSAALDVCVASSIAAAARGDAAQVAFDRKLAHCRNLIVRQQNIHYRPLVWTADARPHPAVARTLQYAADIRFQQEWGSICRRSPFIADGSMKSKSLSCGGGPSRLARFSQIPLRGWGGS